MKIPATFFAERLILATTSRYLGNPLFDGTEGGQEDDRRRARKAGIDHHLVEPAELEPLPQLPGSPK